MMQAIPLRHELEIVLHELNVRRTKALERIPECYDDATRLFACEEATAFSRAARIINDAIDAELKSGKDCTPPWEKRRASDRSGTPQATEGSAEYSVERGPSSDAPQ